MAVSTVRAQFPCTVQQLWSTVTDLAHTAWRSDLVRVEVLDDARFIEHTKGGHATAFTVTACQPPCRWAFVMESEDLSGSWEGSFEAAEGGAVLTCTEAITARHWWMRPLVPVYLRRQQRRYLQDLRRALAALAEQ